MPPPEEPLPPPPPPEEPRPESAWERGLRTAKEVSLVVNMEQMVQMFIIFLDCASH